MTDGKDGRLHFPGRDVLPWAVPVAESELQVGHTYFTVHFTGPRSLDPQLEALVYIGVNLFPGQGVEGFYFQDASSYAEGLRYDVGEEAERPALELMQPGQVRVMHYENALDLLLRYSLLRREAGLR